MIDTPEIVRTDERSTAVIRLAVPRAAIRTVVGPGVAELMSAAAAQGIAVAGPWCVHHFRRPADTFDFEICVPVASPVAAAGRVTPGRVPAMTAARTTYRGPYEGLAAAWGEFRAWIAAAGRKPAEDLWECYVVGPESTPDPAGWRTELTRPLLGTA